MNRNAWRGLMIGTAIFLMDPLSAATSPVRREMPWPALLAAGPVQTDPAVATLQHRANASLERLLRTAPANG
jgi:hypothetical protein